MIESNQTYDGEQFVGLDLSNQTIRSSTFEGCEFIDCNFNETEFLYGQIIECDFVRCNFTLASFNETRVAKTEFDECKCVGVNWTRLILETGRLSIGRPISFKKCTLNYGIFLGMKLENIQFLKCEAVESDFREANLTKADFADTNLERALFQQTKLVECASERFYPILVKYAKQLVCGLCGIDERAEDIENRALALFGQSHADRHDLLESGVECWCKEEAKVQLLYSGAQLLGFSIHTNSKLAEEVS